MQAEENRWRQAEQVLRRLVGRLCAAGMGIDPQLDDELSALAAANRRNANAEELGRMADSLTSVVVAVDAAAPVPTQTMTLTQPALFAREPAPQVPTLEAIQAALGALLEQLPLDSSLGATRIELQAELAAAAGEAAFTAVVTRAADLMGTYSDSIARERLQAAAL